MGDPADCARIAALAQGLSYDGSDKLKQMHAIYRAMHPLWAPLPPQSEELADEAEKVLSLVNRNIRILEYMGIGAEKFNRIQRLG